MSDRVCTFERPGFGGGGRRGRGGGERCMEASEVNIRRNGMGGGIWII